MYKHKNILITGASSGLGRNIALHYAKEGGRIINISRSIPKMETLQKELCQQNTNKHMYFSADVSNYQEIKMIQKEMSTQRIYPDIIINNDNLSPIRTVEEIIKVLNENHKLKY